MVQKQICICTCLRPQVRERLRKYIALRATEGGWSVRKGRNSPLVAVHIDVLSAAMAVVILPLYQPG